MRPDMSKTWQEFVAQAKHYKAIGSTDIYLFNDTEAPWHLATEASRGGTHRLGVSVSLDFRGKHESGLSFRWGCDIEDRNASGQSKFVIDMPRLNSIMAKLPAATSKKMATILRETAKAVRKQGDEYQSIADDQYKCARQLEAI